MQSSCFRHFRRRVERLGLAAYLLQRRVYGWGGAGRGREVGVQIGKEMEGEKGPQLEEAGGEAPRKAAGMQPKRPSDSLKRTLISLKSSIGLAKKSNRIIPQHILT